MQDVIEGTGRYVYASGDIYQGEFKSGKRHGQGSYHNQRVGCQYVGRWEAGGFVSGHWILKDGSMFAGAFKNGVNPVRGDAHTHTHTHTHTDIHTVIRMLANAVSVRMRGTAVLWHELCVCVCVCVLCRPRARISSLVVSCCSQVPSHLRASGSHQQSLSSEAWTS